MAQFNVDFFLEIAKTGSFTKAAERLYVSQPSLSQSIKRLENSLGTQLFDRSSSPLRLTHAGEMYYEYAIRSKELDLNIQTEIQNIRSGTAGCIRLGLALWRGASLLPDILPDFHRLYPLIQFELTEGSFVELQAALENELVDLVVVNTPRTSNPKHLAYEILCSERIVIGIPTRCEYAQKLQEQCEYDRGFPVVSPEILERLPLIITKPSQALTIKVENYLASVQIRPELLLRTGNLTTAINLVGEGMGCTFVPEMGVKVCQRPGKVTYLSLNSPDLDWNLAVAYKRGRVLSRISSLFIDYMKEKLKKAKQGRPAAAQPPDDREGGRYSPGRGYGDI